MNIGWLKSVCGEGFGGASPGFMKSPESVSGWAVASDGHCLVAIQGDFGLPICAATKGVEKWIAEEVGGVEVPMADLREFVAGIPLRESCKQCKGTGKLTCPTCSGDYETECECLHCGDQHMGKCQRCDFGKILCSDCDADKYARNADHGRILGVLVNRKLLARAVANLPGEGILQIRTRGQEGMISFYGDGWRMFLMPMRQFDKSMKVNAELTTKPAAASEER